MCNCLGAGEPAVSASPGLGNVHSEAAAGGGRRARWKVSTGAARVLRGGWAVRRVGERVGVGRGATQREGGRGVNMSAAPRHAHTAAPHTPQVIYLCAPERRSSLIRGPVRQTRGCSQVGAFVGRGQRQPLTRRGARCFGAAERSEKNR